jgi:hypothetical protein
MGKSILNSALGSISGGIDKWVYRQVNGRTVISKRPQFSATPSEAQMAVQARFRKAAKYAHDVMLDPVRRAFYDAFALARKQGLHNTIMTDSLRIPVVDAIDLAGLHGAVGDRIVVHATDDVGVTEVTVEIRAEDDTLLEQGAATVEGAQWVYATTVAHPAGTPVTITATAVDRPGNKGSKFTTWS